MIFILKRVTFILALITIGIISIKYYGLFMKSFKGIYKNIVLSQLTSKPDSHITRIIHQSWKTKNVPPRFYHWSKSWHSCFPNWEYRLWTDEDNRQLIKDYYPWFLGKYNSLPSEIYRADVVRYFYLYHFGGIYADLDADCLRPFEHLLNKKYNIVLGAMEGRFGEVHLEEGYLQNSFMYSRPRHPFWLEVINETVTRHGGAPERYTGPLMLTEVLNRYRQRHPSNDIHIYPPLMFNPFSWLVNDISECKDVNRMTDEEMTICRKKHFDRGSFVVQYHAQSWGRGKAMK